MFTILKLCAFCCRYEQAHFTVVLSGRTGFWWIGLRAHGGLTGGVDYVWDNGLPLTYTHWDKDQPGRGPRAGLGPLDVGVPPGNSSVRLSPDSGDGSCVAMAADKIGGFWDDKQCTEKFFFFCEKFRPDITPPTKPPTPPPSQGCADGWTALPHFRNCYKVAIDQREVARELPSAELSGPISVLALPQRGLAPEEELGSSS